MSTRRIRTDPELAVRQVNAAASWERDANLPDVLRRKDLAHDGTLTAAVLDGRARDERGPEPALTLPYPKDDGQFRRVCVLDPFDDLWFSLLASAVAPFVNAAQPPADVVLSTRFLPFETGVFRAEGWREARKRRGASLDRSGRRPLGGFDVENHFETISRSSIIRLMNSCFVPAWTVEWCRDFLDSFAAWPGASPGLPTGPMASALFGTLALLPVDRRLMELGVPYERWVDDIVIQPSDERHFEDVRDAVNDLLRPHQRLNPEKDWFEAGNERDPSDFDFEAVDPDEGGVSLEALKVAVAEGDPKRCRFVLGGLRWRKDRSAVSFVVSSEQTWQLVPKHSGNYLRTFHADLNDEQLALMSDQCSSVPSRESAAGIAHRAGVLAICRVPASCGQALYEAGERASTGEFRALTPALYLASSMSKEKARVRQRRSIDTASVLRDLNCQRGLIAGLRHDTRPRVVARGLKALGRSVPDLRPTVEWVTAGRS